MLESRSPLYHNQDQIHIRKMKKRENSESIKLKRKKKRILIRLPGGEVIDVADEHLELASTLRCEASVHLNGHGVSHLSELGYGGPTLFLNLLQDRHSPGPPSRALHPVSHHQRRRSTNRRRAHHRRPHRHLPHSLSLKKYNSW